MKKRLTVLLMAALMLMSLCVPAYAGFEDRAIEYTGDYCPETLGSIKAPEPIELPYGPDKQHSTKYVAEGYIDVQKLFFDLEKKVKAAILAGEEEVDVSHLMIYPDKVNLSTLEFFSPYLSDDFDLRGYYYTGSYYSHIKITSKISPAEAADYFAKVDSKVASIKSMVETYPSAMEKALALHDYFAYTAEYDQSASIPQNSYRCAGIIMDEVAVCNGYAYAFMYFLGLAGIECHIASSDPMNHAWNIVKINGNYYHVDITWDDKTPDTLGKVYHDHFLVSDEAISQPRGGSSKSHYNWDETHLVCSDKSLDNAFWTQTKSSIVDDGTYFYFIKDSQIIKRVKSSGAETKIADLGVWRTWEGNGSWIGSFSGICLIGRDVYYNTSTQIRKINVDSLADSLVLEPDTSEGYIFGSSIKNGVLRYVLKKDANEQGSILSRDISGLIPQNGISIEPDVLQLQEGESFRLNVVGSTEGLVWSSADESIAEVSQDGTVTAKKTGTTTITAVNGESSAASCVITVGHSHSYSSSVVEPDCENGGYTEYICPCGDSYITDEREPLGHDERIDPAVEPGCTEDGLKEGAHCARCGAVLKEQLTDPAKGHSWYEVEREEAAEDKDGYVIYICENCGADKKEILPATDHAHIYTYEIILPGCVDSGFTIFTCSVCGHSYEGEYTQPAGHSWDEGKVTKEPTEDEEGERTFTCTLCGETDKEPIAPLNHVHSYTTVIVEPGCTEEGYTRYSCTCGDSYTDSVVPAKGHNWDDGVVTKKPTEEKEGERTFTCTLCGETDMKPIAPLNHVHSYTTVIVEPGCTEEGYTRYSCVCGDSYTGDTVPAKGHSWGTWELFKESNCKEQGVNIRICSACYETETELLPMGDHKWDKGKVTKEPTVGFEGVKTFTCTVCKETKTEKIDKLPDTPKPVENPFKDVSETDYFFEPVMWAVDKGVTSGLSKFSFGPAAGCTRAQVVTFLWRAAGEPAPKSSVNPFNDVKEGQYYYDAVLWAVEEGITTGLSKTSFGPNENCNRGQIVTFLWRAMAKPAPESSTNPFRDVSESQYYYDAVLWAVEEGITTGMGAASFAPNATCTRGQIVTFLYRAYK